MSSFKTRLKNFLRPIKYLNRIGYSQLSYSQEGEDLILSRFFLGKKKGFYVDIGAHHPFRFSNTYYFYRRGWSGINIDPLPKSMKLFNSKRARDINLEIGISEIEDTISYYIFDEPTLNGFSKEQTEEYIRTTRYKLLDTVPIRVYPLSFILDKHLQGIKSIDFFNIDVEGYDLQVLKSNNWNRYRPKLILVEDHKTNPDDIKNSEIYIFLKEQSYNFYGKSVLTYFYVDNDNGDSNFNIDI